MVGDEGNDVRASYSGAVKMGGGEGQGKGRRDGVRTGRTEKEEGRGWGREGGQLQYGKDHTRRSLCIHTAL